MSLKNKFHIIIPPQDISADKGMLMRFVEGDKQAFAWIYKNYAGKVYDYALLMTNDTCQSEDIVQDIFIRLWTKREKFRQVQNFNWYLNVMMRNSMVDHFQGKAKEKANHKDYISWAEITMHEDEPEICQEEKLGRLEKAVDMLSTRQKQVYHLQRQAGLNRHQIAQELNLSALTVKTHIRDGLRVLKKKMALRQAQGPGNKK